MHQELALLAFKNYRYLHQVATNTPRRQKQQRQQQQQQQQRPSQAATESKDPAAAATSRPRGFGTAGKPTAAAAAAATGATAAAVRVTAAAVAAAAAGGAAADQPQQPPAPPLESASDVRRALQGLRQKQKLVNTTLSNLKHTQKANAVLQVAAERQQKRLLKEQQENERMAKLQRIAAASVAAKPAATEAEKKEILEKMLQLKSSVADIVDQASLPPSTHTATAAADASPGAA